MKQLDPADYQRISVHLEVMAAELDHITRLTSRAWGARWAVRAKRRHKEMLTLKQLVDQRFQQEQAASGRDGAL